MNDSPDVQTLTAELSSSNAYSKMIDFTPIPHRREALRLLGALGRDAAPRHAHGDPLHAVIEVFATSPRARDTLLSEVCTWPVASLEPLLDILCSNDTGESMDFAVEILARRGLDDLLAWVESRRRRPGASRWFVEVLGDLDDLEAARVLIALLDDYDQGVRQHASDVLCSRRSRLDERALVRRLAKPLVRGESHPDPLLAVRALHRLADASLEPDFGPDAARRAEKVLRNCVIHEKRGAVRGDAIAALGEIGSRSSVRCLVDMLHRDDSAWHREVVIALRKIRPERALIALLGLLQSRDPIIREEAANALGEIGDRQAVKRLRALLRDEDLDVRQEAVLALGKLGGREVLDALDRALDDSSAAVRIAACSALAESLGRQAQAKLIGALYDLSPDVRAEAAYLLGSIGDDQAEPHLQRWVEDEQRDGFGDRVGAVAQRALLRLWAARRYGRDSA